MKRRRVPWMLTAKWWIPLVAGGVVLQFNLTGCDPDVRNTVLTGIQTAMTGLFTSVINAFFLSLQATDSTTSQPVVRAIFENISNWLA